MVAIFLPRRFAMLEEATANSRGRLAVCADWFGTQGSQAEPCLEMCPCRTVRSEPRTVGVSPAQDASLRALPKRVMSPISASIINAVNWPTPGSVVRTLTRGSALGMLVQLAVDPVDQRRQAVDDRQAVSDDLPRRRRQVQLGQPPATRAGPVAGGPVIAEV